MDSTTNQEGAECCNNCGRENSNRLIACAGCGVSLDSTQTAVDTEPKGKSLVLAVCLALAFGPIGLLYVRAWWPAFIMLMFAAPFIITHTGGLWLTIGSRIICAALAYRAVVELDVTPNPNRDSARLLDEAARLENVDRSKAVAAYEEIVRMYPNTSASKEAKRNIQSLKRQL